VTGLFALVLLASAESEAQSPWSFGGYGEMHANYTADAGGDMFDIHRLVFYVGHQIAPWVQFNTEMEIEHAFVKGGNGEISLEQAFMDFNVGNSFGVRVGRMLIPMGIVNERHEPPTFFGVERPSFYKYIVPSTWFSDGAGVFGSYGATIGYRAYVLAGLDGSSFGATDGIRGGRLKERPSLNEPAGILRLDVRPAAERLLSMGQTAQIGLSLYYGGIDNGNKGGDPGVDGSLLMYAVDAEYLFPQFEVRGAFAHQIVDGAEKILDDTGEIEGVAGEMFGWTAEAGVWLFRGLGGPGKLGRAELALFARYDDYDTQYKMPSGVSADPAGDREEWTVGLSFYPVSGLVLKADYQFRKDVSNLYNFGMGWMF